MTTLTLTKECVKHIPHIPAISMVNDDQFTFCEVCENNIERWYNDTDPDCLPSWTKWRITK